MNRLVEFIEDINGKLSAKRLCGIGAFLVASAVVLLEAMKEAPFDSGLMWAYATSFAGAIAIGTATEQVLKKKHDSGTDN